VPIGAAFMIGDPKVNWHYRSEPDGGNGQRRLPVPRGKMLGGSSAINGMVFTRGQKEDYDHWSQLGCRGWSYQDVLPLFKKIESYDGGADEYRGRGGPMKLSDTVKYTPLFELIMRAAENIGIERNPDYNGAYQEGVCMTQASIYKGRRQSAATCYLDPARHRPNLTLQQSALASRLLFEDKRCVGVRYTMQGREMEARVNREVIVSTGAVNTPQLLELSGIGRRDLLEEHGIEVVHELPGVGENLRDHFSPFMIYEINRKGLSLADLTRGPRYIQEGLKYILLRKDFIAQAITALRVYARTRGESATADTGISFMPYIAERSKRGPRISRTRGLSMYVHVLRPESRGSIHIKSADANEAPAIRFNFLSDTYDRHGVVLAMRKARELMSAPPLCGIVQKEVAPGPEHQSDDELLDWAANNGITAYHPVGTCKMGHDPMAVVDDQLRVHGVTGLRVADASIMPTLTSGNTAAPAMMIGEKCAELILASAA
jgi:choline dehydrogenase